MGQVGVHLFGIFLFSLFNISQSVVLCNIYIHDCLTMLFQVKNKHIASHNDCKFILALGVDANSKYNVESI